jgi:hypothetical protein
MNTYYISEIDLNQLNKKKIISKLKKNILFHEITEQSILSKYGMYKIKNEKIIKYKIINKKHYMVKNFLDKYTLFFNKNILIKDKNIQYNIPFDHTLYTSIKIFFYNAEYSKNKMVFELDIHNNKILNVYFTSNEDENDYNFREDMSSYLKMLNV